MEVSTLFLISCGRLQECDDRDGEHVETAWNYIIKVLP